MYYMKYNNNIIVLNLLLYIILIIIENKILQYMLEKKIIVNFALKTKINCFQRSILSDNFYYEVFNIWTILDLIMLFIEIYWKLSYSACILHHNYKTVHA